MGNDGFDLDLSRADLENRYSICWRKKEEETSGIICLLNYFVSKVRRFQIVAVFWELKVAMHPTDTVA